MEKKNKRTFFELCMRQQTRTDSGSRNTVSDIIKTIIIYLKKQIIILETSSSYCFKFKQELPLHIASQQEEITRVQVKMVKNKKKQSTYLFLAIHQNNTEIQHQRAFANIHFINHENEQRTQFLLSFLYSVLHLSQQFHLACHPL